MTRVDSEIYKFCTFFWSAISKVYLISQPHQRYSDNVKTREVYQFLGNRYVIANPFPNCRAKEIT